MLKNPINLLSLSSLDAPETMVLCFSKHTLHRGGPCDIHGFFEMVSFEAAFRVLLSPDFHLSHISETTPISEKDHDES